MPIPDIIDDVQEAAAQATAALVRQRPVAAVEAAPTPAGKPGVPPATVKYEKLLQRNPEFDGDYWEQLCALYSGGRKLLNNKALLERIFPRHRDEVPRVYEERKRRAFYVNYAAEIVDFIVANLMSEPYEITVGEDAEGGESWPPFYDDFQKNVAPDGAEKMPLVALVRRQMLKALQCKTAWTLCEMPASVDEDGQAITYDSLGDQEKSGALSAWAVPLDPCAVVDWQEDDDGELLWMLVATQDAKRASIDSDRGWVTKRWMYYTADAWARYELTHEVGKEPDPETMVAATKQGRHTFGKVPVCRMALPDGLWAMDKLESLAREHFNKRSALGWAETQSLLPDLYEFLAPELPGGGAMIGENQEDPKRAVNQRRGQGYVQQRGGGDRAEFIGPDSAPFTHAMASCSDLRDEMHRVTHQMALTIDNSPSALKRSAESRSQDKAATAVVLIALAEIVRDHVQEILRMISRGRGDDKLAYQWAVQGMDDYEAEATGSLVEEAVALETISIKSPTFRKRSHFRLAKRSLGNDATPEDLEAIEQELEQNVTAEEFAPGADLALEPAAAGAGAPAAGARTGRPAPAKG
jgi:hypothetical protein